MSMAMAMDVSFAPGMRAKERRWRVESTMAMFWEEELAWVGSGERGRCKFCRVGDIHGRRENAFLFRFSYANDIKWRSIIP